MNIANVALLVFGVPASVGMLWAAWTVGREDNNNEKGQ